MVELSVENLTLGYEGRAVVEGLSFTVEKGDYLYILGENGSGKSTLIKALLGLHPAMAGHIRRGEGLADGIGYLPQQTDVQRDFPASVLEIVRSGFAGRRGLRPFYTQAEKAEAARNMERLGIAHLARRCYRELSGGQQQRVLLARALCASHKMLLLDEPVAGLDVVATKEMYALIERLNAEQGITVLMVSHDVEAAVQYANKVLFVGKEIFFGSKQAFLQQGGAGRAFGGGYEHL